MNAEEMFKNIGYEPISLTNEILAYSNPFTSMRIEFRDEQIIIINYFNNCTDNIGIVYTEKNLLQAINQQVKELGW